MAAIVRPIEARTVHQIQSGQVIVDLCSVVKELVENSLDAGANAIEVRFKNNGLDEIEVQDNGAGIAAVNYESVALKHYTSKLSTYDDLSSLRTFGFRGEALSSLCALSVFTVTTAQADEAPKGHCLEFDVSGKLKDTSLVACQKGTIATVRNLFETLPVRRKELSKNIKREYGKVLSLLHAYACISTGVKITVKNAMPKGKSLTVFGTQSNATTRENIANIYGSKTLAALVALDLDFDFPHCDTPLRHDEPPLTKVSIRGHISKPVFGEGRQTPDRQMFYVNGRPCGLPQMAKTVNEVYKSFNVSQSPFILADLQLDTNAYDVNVSPDKRTIFLHNATALTEGLKNSLTELFDQQDHTVPHSHLPSSNTLAFKQSSLQRHLSTASSRRSSSIGISDYEPSEHIESDSDNDLAMDERKRSNRVVYNRCEDLVNTLADPGVRETTRVEAEIEKEIKRRAPKGAGVVVEEVSELGGLGEYDDTSKDRERIRIPASGEEEDDNNNRPKVNDTPVRDFNTRMAERREEEQVWREHQHGHCDLRQSSPEYPITALAPVTAKEAPGIVPNAFSRMRPQRQQPEVAVITIGDKTVTRFVGSQAVSHESPTSRNTSSRTRERPVSSRLGKFAHNLQRFSAAETQSVDYVDLERIDDEDGNNERELIGPWDDAERMVLPAVGGQVHSSINHDEQLETSTYPIVMSNPEEDNSDHDVEQQEKEAERQRVTELIRLAEDTNHQTTRGEKRVVQALKSNRAKDRIVSLNLDVEIAIKDLQEATQIHWSNLDQWLNKDPVDGNEDANDSTSTAEEQLSLKVSKRDFIDMHIVGQFNLGFILAVRTKQKGEVEKGSSDNDELFIIDQHASDEKYNFERLQSETVVGNQRMVRPAILDLTAVEEEIVVNNQTALTKNGFIVEVDTSGVQNVGSRCRLVSLPLSKEVVFGTSDLDELIHLLTESPMLNESSAVPRPSKVRKMFAMRACRSSIMIGKTLSRKQMSTVLQHMGSIDKPWNCPHGRPTMRHLATLDTLEASLWREGDGVFSGSDHPGSGRESDLHIWRRYAEDTVDAVATA